MTARRRTLGAQLAWLVTLSTALGLVVFTAVASLVVWIDEAGEDDDLEDLADPDDHDDSAFEEVLDDLGLAVAVATPAGLLVAIAGARWAARRVTARVDALIATASRITADRLDERLPVSPRRDELDELAVALNTLFARIDDGVAALRSFAADASHELRTPLAVMINALEVARLRPRDVAEWERVSAATLDELRRMADLTEALLHSARAGAFDLDDEPVELDAALAEIAGRWRPAATTAGVTLAVEAETGATAHIDPRALAIAVGNLLGNAIAHSPRGGAVTLRASRDDGRLRIDVDDQGDGVAPQDRDRIFEPFVRGETAARAHPAAGVGLGLSIARRIAEAQGGRVGVDAAPGGGARFTLELVAPALSRPARSPDR